MPIVKWPIPIISANWPIIGANTDYRPIIGAPLLSISQFSIIINRTSGVLRRVNITGALIMLWSADNRCTSSEHGQQVRVGRSLDLFKVGGVGVVQSSFA